MTNLKHTLLLSGTILTAMLVSMASSSPDIHFRKSNAVVTSVRMSAEHTRYKRALPATEFTQAQQIEIVNQHNADRRLEPAADMFVLRWHDGLARMAQAWADVCDFRHDQPSENPTPWTQLGQNLAVYGGWPRIPRPEATRAVIDWNNEKPDYDYDSDTCRPGKMCGHYTQDVWASTRYVGCGIRECDRIASTGWSFPGWNVVCNYGPPGNWVGQKPFLIGTPCTACGGGKFWCRDGLCDTQEDCQQESGCSCLATANCYNCATPNQNDCTCQCASGWRGNQCRDVCQNLDPLCGANPGYPAFWCNTGRAWVDDGCPALCGACQVNANRQTCPPGDVCAGRVCNNGGTPQASGTTCTCRCTSLWTGDSCSVSVCEGTVCENGGTPQPTGNTCKCECPSEWQGEQCTESVRQARFGVVVRIRAPLDQWQQIWNILQLLVAQGITTVCNTENWYQACCPGSSLEGVSFNPLLPYMTPSNVNVGLGFPQQRGGSLLVALLYAQVQPGTQLCEAGAPARRKRQTTTDLLDQDVLLEAIKDQQSQIDSQLRQCCNTQIESVEKAVVEGDSGAGRIVTSLLVLMSCLLTQLIL